jgi:integrase
LRDRFKRRVEGDPWVFPSHGATGHVVDLKDRWRVLLKRAQIENLRIHDLRRTQGSWQAAQGASLQIIGKALGHSSVASTEIYSRLSLDPVRVSMAQANAAMQAAAKRKPRITAAARG